MGSPAGTRLHGRTHSRCLKSPHLLTCCPRHNFGGCRRQASGPAHTCGENRRRRVPGWCPLHGSHGAGTVHAHTHAHTQQNGDSRRGNQDPRGKRRGSWGGRIPVGRWSPSEGGPDGVRLGPGDLQSEPAGPICAREQTHAALHEHNCSPRRLPCRAHQKPRPRTQASLPAPRQASGHTQGTPGTASPATAVTGIRHSALGLRSPHIRGFPEWGGGSSEVSGQGSLPSMHPSPAPAQAPLARPGTREAGNSFPFR